VQDASLHELVGERAGDRDLGAADPHDRIARQIELIWPHSEAIALFHAPASIVECESGTQPPVVTLDNG
jgi:hypothetical protein